MMSVRYLVTGAAGHLGSTVVRLLCQQGERVRGLVLPGDPAAALLPDHVEQVEGNVCDNSAEALFTEQAPGEETIVIHAAGIVSIASHDDPRVRAVNVDGTKNIIALCKKYGVRKLVHVSSVHAIPELPSGETICEVNHFCANDVSGLYAKTKAEATQAVLDAAAEGLNASVVHPSGILGPYDPGHGHLTQLVIDYCRGKLTACVNGGYDFCDVRDVARGILACCQNGRSGECYILSGHFCPVSQLLGLLQQITGHRAVKTVLPRWFACATAPLAETYYKLRRQPPLYTSYSLYTLNTNAAFSHEKAERELGYTVTPLKITLQDTVQWLSQQGKI